MTSDEQLLARIRESLVERFDGLVDTDTIEGHVALMDRASLHGVHLVHAESAGAEPNACIEPVVMTAMVEIGLDLTIDRPKPVTTRALASGDLVVRTDSSCAVPDGKTHLDWDVPDPGRLGLADVRRIRDDIDGRVQGLLADLLKSA